MIAATIFLLLLAAAAHYDHFTTMTIPAHLLRSGALLSLVVTFADSLITCAPENIAKLLQRCGRRRHALVNITFFGTWVFLLEFLLSTSFNATFSPLALHYFEMCDEWLFNNTPMLHRLTEGLFEPLLALYERSVWVAYVIIRAPTHDNLNELIVTVISPVAFFLFVVGMLAYAFQTPLCNALQTRKDARANKLRTLAQLTKENETLRQTISRQEKELAANADLNKQYSIACTDLHDAEKKLADQSAELRDMDARLGVATHRYVTAEEKEDRGGRFYRSMEGTYNARAALCKEQAAEIDRLKSQLAEKNRPAFDIHQQYEKRLNDAKKNERYWMKMYEDSKTSQRIQSFAHNEDANVRVRELETEVKQLKATNASQKTKIGSLRARSTANPPAHPSASQLLRERDNLKSECNDLRNQLQQSGMSTQVSQQELNARIEELKQQNTDSTTRLSSTKQELTDAFAQIAKLEQRLRSEAVSTVKIHGESLVNANAYRSRAHKELQTLRDKYSKFKAKAQQDTKTAKEQMQAALEAQNKNLEQQFAQEKAEILAGNFFMTEQEKQDLEAKYNTMVAERDTAMTQLQNNGSETERLRQEIQNLRLQLEAATNAANTAHTGRYTTEQVQEAISNETAPLRAELQQAFEFVNGQKAELDKAANEAHDRGLELQQAMERIQWMHTKGTKLQEEVQHWRNVHASLGQTAAGVGEGGAAQGPQQGFQQQQAHQEPQQRPPLQGFQQAPLTQSHDDGQTRGVHRIPRGNKPRGKVGGQQPNSQKEGAGKDEQAKPQQAAARGALGGQKGKNDPLKQRRDQRAGIGGGGGGRGGFKGRGPY